MLRRVLAIVCVAGLLLNASVWLTAAIVAMTHTPRADGVTVGYAHGQKWLVNALVYSDGQMFCRLFRPNLTHHNGLYGARILGVRPSETLRIGTVSPGRLSHSIRLHIAMPLALFGALSFLVLGVPAIRRARRCRLGRCLGCGYDMRKLGSTTCPECGHAEMPPS